jgi:PIN domain nuclease of toxin-antitoxin system
VIVLDTHAWVWWLTKPSKLGAKAARALEKTDRIGIPAICPWEIAVKAQRGKLKFNRPYELWIDEALSLDPRIELLHLMPRIAVDAVRLSWKHGDPADRFIVATARAHEAPLVTADETIHASRLVRCVWD